MQLCLHSGTKQALRVALEGSARKIKFLNKRIRLFRRKTLSVPPFTEKTKIISLKNQ
jgi:hypothetical protein